MIIDELVAVLGFKLEGEADRRKFEQGLKRAERSVNEFSKNVTAITRRAVLGIAAIGGAMGAALSKSVVGVNAQFEGFAATLETIEGSSQKAKKSLDWVAQFAKTTPYEVAEVTNAFVRLRAYGMDPMDGTLKSMGDAAAGMGKPLMQAVEALADAATGEFERLKEFGIKAQSAGNQVTFSWQQDGKEFRKTLGKNSAEITKFLRDTLGGRFQGAMERQSRTFTGLVSNLSDSWVDFQRRIGEAGFFDVIKKRLEGLLATIARLDADGTLDRWATNISDVLEKFAEGIGNLAARVQTHFGTLQRLFKENADAINEWKWPLFILLGYFLVRSFPIVAAIGAIVTALDELMSHINDNESYLGDFIETLATFFDARPEEIAAILRDIGSAALWLLIGAIGLTTFAGGIRKLASALGELKKFAGFMGRLAGFKWAATAAGAAAVAGAATGTAAAATGAGAAGVAGNAASKAPWLPGMRSPLGRLLGPMGTIGSTGFDLKWRMDRLAVLTEQNGGDQVKALEELQRETSMSVYEAADKMTKVLEAIKENTQGLLEKMGLGWMTGGGGGGKSAIADAIRASGYQGTGGTYEGGQDRDALRLGVYDSFRKAGYSHEGALAMAAEVGRENSFNPNLVFGSHTDPHNKVRNSGFFSWQKDRGDKLMAFLDQRGLVKNGKIVRGQASLDAMAEFSAHEMKRMAPDLDQGLRSGSLNYAQANRGLGKRYIKWRYDDPRYAHHHRFRDQHRAKVAALVKARGESSASQNLAGNLARIDGATAATNATMVANHRAVTQNITVGDVHAAPGERVDRATARAVGTAAAGAGRVSEPARIAAQQAALP